MAQAPLNQDEKMNIMKEMPSNFPFVDIKLFAAYWKWYAEIGIKCGLPKEDIVDIIQQVTILVILEFCNKFQN